MQNDKPVIDLTLDADAAARAAGAAMGAAEDAAKAAQAAAEDAGPPRKRKRVDEREAFRQRAQDMALRHFVQPFTFDVDEDFEDGTYTATLVENSYDAEHDEIVQALNKYFKGTHADLAHDLDRQDYKKLFGHEALAVDIDVDVNHGEACIIDARVTVIEDAQWNAICAIE